MIELSVSQDKCDRTDWYALYTRHNHEKTVAEILMSKGLETFLPLYEAAHRWKDRTKVLSRPLFPCYVFLKGALERRLDVLTTPGVHFVVSTAGKPAAIPVGEVDAIRRVIESGERVEPHSFLKYGEQVRVRCGPLTGLQGILVRKKNLYRMVVSVEMLGKAVSLEIDGAVVEQVGQATVRPMVPFATAASLQTWKSSALSLTSHS